MSNDSSVAGFLRATSAPIEDDALDDFIQSMLVGITGIDGTMVRPRWQPEPANIPPFGTNWVAFGITEVPADTFASVEHSGSGQGSDTVYRQEILRVLCSFYGPNSGGNANALRDGLSVPQNREAFLAQNMGLVEVGGRQVVPELIKMQWWKRVDLPVVLRRSVSRVYAVLNVLTATGQLVADTEIHSPYIAPISVTQ